MIRTLRSLGAGLDPDVFVSMLMSMELEAEELRQLEKQHLTLVSLADNATL